MSLIRFSAPGRRRVARPFAALLGLVALPTTLVLGASSASACDINTHCYGMTNTTSPNVVGAAITIGPSCLAAPSGNFITDEIWLVDSTGHWTETGFIQINGVAISGLPTNGRFLFWGDYTPSHQFSGHVVTTNPALTNTRFSIYENGVNSYAVTAGTFSTSSSNSMAAQQGQYGSEDTANSGAHSYGYFYSSDYLIGSTWNTGTNGTSGHANAPEAFSWNTLGSTFFAGVPC